MIGATTTKTGLKVECVLDTRTYEKGLKVSDAEMDKNSTSSAIRSILNGTTLSDHENGSDYSSGDPK